MILGDLGAQVIKVERPGSGDETRGWGPPFDERGESAYYLSVNRNKKSLAADIDNADDRELLLDLASSADVVVENFRPGSLERRGLAALPLLTSHPNLIWCTITGFGPDSVRPGYDFVVQAECGWMAITGDPEGSPMKAGVALADVIAGKDAAIAILAALLSRRTSMPAADRHLVISLAATATAALVNVAQNVLVSGADAARWGNAHANLVPYELFQASDRAIVIAVGSDAQWIACTRALGLADLAEAVELARNAGRLAHRGRVVAALRARIVTEPARHWISRLESAGVPCGLVRSVREALASVAASPLTGVAPSVPGSVRLPPPLLNEHGADIRNRGWDSFTS